MAVRNEEELAGAIQKKQSVIEVEGDIGRRIIRIKAVGAIAWALLLGALLVILASMVSTGGTVGGLVAAPLAVPIVTIVGPSAAATIIALAMAAGGIGILSSLRSDYRVVSDDGRKVTLKRK